MGRMSTERLVADLQGQTNTKFDRRRGNEALMSGMNDLVWIIVVSGILKRVPATRGEW